jgi:hypothetical protein
MEVPQKLKIDPLDDPTISLLGIYLKEYKLMYNLSMLIEALFTIANCEINQGASK